MIDYVLKAAVTAAVAIALILGYLGYIPQEWVIDVLGLAVTIYGANTTYTEYRRAKLEEKLKGKGR
jgi:hypothetical protein